MNIPLLICALWGLWFSGKGWSLEDLHTRLDDNHAMYQQTGVEAYKVAALALTAVYNQRMLAACLENGLSTTVSPRDLLELKQRTSSPSQENASRDDAGRARRQPW